MVGPPSPVKLPGWRILFLQVRFLAIKQLRLNGGGMNKNTNNAPSATGPHIEELGLWGFALLWIKVISSVAVIVLILKYVFKIPFTF